jgi:MFS family permease
MLHTLCKGRASLGNLRPSEYVCLARAVRDFGDGFVAVLLPSYLTIVGLGPFEVGIVASVALFGSAILTLVVGQLGIRMHQRTLLVLSALLMTITGFSFATVTAYPAILLVAFIGTINPSAGNVSIFVPLEHAVLSNSVADKERTTAFAYYSLYGALAAAAGAMVSASPEYLIALGISQLSAFRSMFAFYALLGVVGGLLYSRMPFALKTTTERKQALGPSRHNVYKLAALFSIDAFAGGFAVQSLVALWLFRKFDMSLQAVGIFFFWSGILAAFSLPVAAWLAKRIGLINTMVFTHIPSSIFLIIAALVPNREWALGLLLARSALSQMDVPTRSSYVMSIVTPAERPAAAAVTSVPRSLASAVSPALAGALLAAGVTAWPLVICGMLKITYDVALLVTYRKVIPPEEQ